MKTNYLDVTHYFVIKVFDKMGPKGQLIEFKKWDQLSFQIRLKYDWYFKYRAALYQVQYPRFVVETFIGNEPAKGRDLERIRKKKQTSNKIATTKAKNNLASYTNEFEKYQKSYSKIFPIEEEIEYKDFVKNINLMQNKIKKLEEEFKLI